MNDVSLGLSVVFVLGLLFPFFSLFFKYKYSGFVFLYILIFKKRKGKKKKKEGEKGHNSCNLFSGIRAISGIKCLCSPVLDREEGFF